MSSCMACTRFSSERNWACSAVCEARILDD
jgi:hypothetical protein